jgi:hypothetical protein
VLDGEETWLVLDAEDVEELLVLNDEEDEEMSVGSRTVYMKPSASTNRPPGAMEATS